MIILFGYNGYIGEEFKNQLILNNVPFFLWQNTHKTTLKQIDQWYNDLGRPFIRAVINAAGYTGKPNVDACELNKEDTIHGNVTWPQILTDWCVLNDIPLGHVSSGCIYSGKREDGKGFKEEDEPNFTFKQGNCSFYSGTKAIGEKIVNTWEKSYIWRLRIPFDENNNSRNYISKLMKYSRHLKAENSISNKQEFVNACMQTILKNVPYGIYNITNTGYVSTEELIIKLKNTIGKDKAFELIGDEEFYKTCAKTPRSNCVLDNSKLLEVGIKMRSVDEAVDYCLKNWKT